MNVSLRLPLSILALLTSSLAAQTQGTYTVFGNGCPGSGGSPSLPGVVVPAGHDVKWGNSNNYWGVGRQNERYQQVFLATDIGRSQVFTSYQLRPDETFPSTSGGTQSYTVSLGYTLQTPASISATYASNYDTPNGPPKQVFQGTVNLPPVANVPPQLTDWSFTVRFAAPWIFTYNPAWNLVFELANASATSASGAKDAVSGIGANTTRISTGNGPTTPVGQVYLNSGLVMKFNTPGNPVGAVPVLAATSLPDIGKILTVTLAKAKASTVAVFALGASKTTWGPFPLPLDLTAAGAGGCSLLVSLDLLGGVPVDSLGAATVNLPIPNDVMLRGVVFHNQWLVVDSGANTLGIAFSNGGTATIGG
jgi:hypothetical protein